MSKWSVPAGSGAPDEFLLLHVNGTTGRKLHIGRAEAYTTTLCGTGGFDVSQVGLAGPCYTLCPACAKEVGVERAADLPCDADEAAFWAAQQALSTKNGDSQ